MSEQHSINSYHIFILPFRWDNINKNEQEKTQEEYFLETSLNERIKIDDSFHTKILSSDWIYKPFKIDSDLNYNQYNYFYDFVKKSLFNQNENFIEEQIIYSYEKESLSNSNIELKIKGRECVLNLEKVELKVFNTGIGLLCLSIKNSKYDDFDDILKINDFGRRFYPQFIESISGNGDFATTTKSVFLPEKISISKNNNIIISEEFKLNQKDLNAPIRDSSYLLKILNGNKANFSFGFKKDKILIKPLIDDRMFVISYCEQNFDFKNLKIDSDIQDIWYKYLFIDGNEKSCQSDDMTKQLISDSTYDRWIKYDSLYGFTRYSFVNLLSKQTRKLQLNNLKGCYFNIVVLLLTQRASLLRFSEELNLISNLKDDTEEQLFDKFSSIYRNYLKFINNICFDEVSPQEQGIELYDLGIKQLRLETQSNKLEKRIKDIHKFISMDMEMSLFLSKYFD